MATNVRVLQYRCSDDCDMSGCPGHEGTLTHYSVTDGYVFNMAGRELHFKRGELEAILQLLRDLDRADAVQVRA